jgi:hypothetical protein
MADLSPYPTDDDPDAGADLEATGGRPRWVKVFAVIGLALVLLLVVMLLVGGGDHGPGRHSGSDSTVTESDDAGGHARPPGGHG